MGTLIDLTGQKFGILTVIERDPSKHNGRRRFWKCQCECGRVTSVSTTDLRNGHTKSCGYYPCNPTASPMKDLTGFQFGELTVLEQVKSTSYGQTQWRCKCNCGNEIIALGINLRRGNTTSCGHIKSRGETTIIHYLQSHHVSFVPQWHHENFRLSSNWPCRFDFGIYKDAEKTELLFLLEYNGKQHYEASGSGWDTTEALLRTQSRDAEKAKLCEEAGIPLEIIPYTDFNNLEEVLTKLLQKYNLYED